jgi:molecular chaperone DnaK (HSP70)
MKLGIDFGTTRIVIAAADRGNYPLVSFDALDGATADWYPALVALRGTERRYGWAAWEVQTEEGWTIIRSVKRLLEDAGPRTVIELGDEQIPLLEILDGLAQEVHSALCERSNLNLAKGETLQAVLGVPAHANSNQRYLTVEAFRRARFEVLGLLNEPSAASIEFGHRERAGKSLREAMLVYDLGGGTFDASLVVLDHKIHHVIASEGIPSIGGDEFDTILADLALDAANITPEKRDEISAAAWFRLLDECRVKKEALNPNSRRITVELEVAHPEWSTVQIPVADFYDACRPLVEETIAVTEDLLQRHGQDQFDVLYLTGGGSELPIIARMLRERFGRRVRRSAYTRSATAIGLAIQADRPEHYQISEKFSRYFGVWREAEDGSLVTFDPLFNRDSQLPTAGEAPLRAERKYLPVHNIGHFRFLECSHCGADGMPTGEILLWDEIRFPYDPELAQVDNLEREPVERTTGTQPVEEIYECDASGAIAVTIRSEANGFSRTYQLGRWSQDAKPVSPTTRRRKKTESPKRSAQ